MTTPEELRAEADSLLWFHSIDLGQGVRTHGLSELVIPIEQLPEFDGRSVLDVGAWDGYYSFLAEQHGASRVVALDHYAWGVDIPARTRYWQECAAKGVLPDHSRDDAEFWQPDLPGRRPFDLARRVLDSGVVPVVADFTKADLGELGVFDVVLYLGVLYHMKEPLACLERVRAVTGHVAVIETEAVHLHGYDDQPLLQFHQGGDVQSDFGNWFVPTIQAIGALCQAAGFSRTEVVAGPPPTPPPVEPSGALADRLARRIAPPPPAAPPSAPSTNYRAIVHAFV